ncbi:MAG TPA: DUF3570 domain-containing protein [Candidatus Limnocylindria bacterium]|nr:DUF3570 domain-containing protein [Candidatus Limnocylindria bacterium]
MSFPAFQPRGSAFPARRRRPLVLARLVTAWLTVAGLFRLRAENHIDYKFEYYREEGDRTQVSTQTVLTEAELAEWLRARADFVYDSISGATPTGAPPPTGSTEVPTKDLYDIRRAGRVELDFISDRHTLTPSLAYSTEHDYESVTPGLHYSMDLNRRNTTLLAGVSHNFDRVGGDFLGTGWRHKDSTDFVLGITQVLSPTTLVSANLTLGTADGYLSDPYKGVRFDGYPDPDTLFADRRPGHRTKQVAQVTLTQFVEALNGSAETDYRFYHDSFGIFSHTATLTWLQNVGRHLVIAPLVRFYEQTGASFYAPRFAGDPSFPAAFPDVVIPQFYSADYRLSALHTWTWGVSATARLTGWLSLDLAYKRYEMFGDDNATAASNFPKANIYTLGIRAWF